MLVDICAIKRKTKSSVVPKTAQKVADLACVQCISEYPSMVWLRISTTTSDRTLFILATILKAMCGIRAC